MKLDRRGILAGMAASAIGGNSASAQGPGIPIVDTHCHLFDPRRPQGVPYSGPKGQPPQLALPDIYHSLAVPTGIVGSIVIEASPWLEDNLWILERAESDPLFVGVIGSLQPDKPDFAQLSRTVRQEPVVARHPLRSGLDDGPRKGGTQTGHRRWTETPRAGRFIPRHGQPFH